MNFLQINSQKWKLYNSDGLKLFLPRAKLQNAIYFQMDWSFVPPDVDPATVPAEEPRLRLRLIGSVPDLRDWRDLENLFMGYHENFAQKELPETRGPDMWIFQPGATSDPDYSKWETDLTFGERDGSEFKISLEAYRPTERVSKYRTDVAVKQFFQQPVPADWEWPEWINEGDQLSFESSIEFREILCGAPINGARPLEWAKQMAQRELAVEQFGDCTIQDQNSPGKYDVEANTSSGRLVVLQTSI
jgi:hypothetical protein